ncbi:MAG TPA: VWA-like domain-containing protein [Longimicrobiales bacterium]|nr:VWA-like domain-containing protein [Longimicrobiales bacterium]
MPDHGGGYRNSSWPRGASTPSVQEAWRETQEAPWGEAVPHLEALLADARTLLLFRFPFYGRLALRLKWAFTERVSTMAVRVDAYVFFNPLYLERINSGQMAWLIAHALLHLAHGHFERIGDREPERWNRATDVVVDDLLRRSRLPAPPGRQANASTWYQPDVMGAEEVYSTLAFHRPWGPQSGDPRPGLGTGGGDCDHGATEELMRRSRNGTGDHVLSAAQWHDLARDSAFRAKAIGKLPAGMEIFLQDLGTPRLPWHVLLRRWIGPVLSARTAWHRPSRRAPAVRNRLWDTQGVRTTLPGVLPDLTPVVVAWDLSGSISSEEGSIMLTETRAILSQYRRPVRVLTFDVEVHVDQDIADVSAIVPKGGGGTSFVPLFERLAERPGPLGAPACVIVFTDLCGTFPDEPPPYPVVWIDVTGSYGNPPFGELIPYGSLEAVPGSGSRA